MRGWEGSWGQYESESDRTRADISAGAFRVPLKSK
jgi:hypothetical protein